MTAKSKDISYLRSAVQSRLPKSTNNIYNYFNNECDSENLADFSSDHSYFGL